jgi:hydrogenase/urease accessory protein HupE
MIRCRSLFRLLLLFSLVAPLFAHDPGLSSVQIKRVAADLEVVLTFAPGDLAAIGLSAGIHGAAVTDDLVRCYANNRRLPGVARAVSTRTDRANEAAVVVDWRQVGHGAIRVEFPILAKLPFGHRMVLRVGESAEAVALLDARHANWELPQAAEQPPLATDNGHASAWSFVRLGVEHILTGFDHLCFLFALLLAAPRVRDVLAVVTTFTLAHSLTLAAAATGLVSLSPKIVEPLIAVSIVYIGIENLFLRRPPRHRVALVFGFGLVHGLGFASALAERLPGVTGVAVLLPLLGFNAGVELGQLAVAACLIPLIWFARTRATLESRLQPAFSLVIATAGLVWLCQRI